jgi:hypothetical protein
VCSITLLDKLGVDKSQIQPDSLSIRGFNNIGRQLLDIITLPITVVKETLQNHFHVMPYEISYNIILGRPWIHDMHVMPCTLHRIMNYVYKNKVYKVDIFIELESFLKVKKGIMSPLKTLILTSNIELITRKQEEIEETSIFFGDDWGSLEFTHTFMGEYKIINKDSKKEKENIIMTTQHDEG